MQHQGVLSEGELRGANEAAGRPLHCVTAVHVCVDQVLVKRYKHVLQGAEPVMNSEEQ